jgi:hypothetical protein
VRPDQQLAATLMKLFTRLKWFDRVQEIHARQLRKWDILPSAYHYNAVMLSHARQAQWDVCVNLYKCGLADTSCAHAV